ncbi:MAG TPA: type II toxin-antitoxin system RelE/ParE family toxin [Ignavibacteria bacterium]|nr:type II toxin-antitoxin system RelE/ParE family toxin [Ignavibacteria bacterium]
MLAKLKAVELGNLGDYKSIHSKLYEFRINYGPGYRIYFTLLEQRLILLLIGGIKSSQKQDISKALSILKRLEKDNE